MTDLFAPRLGQGNAHFLADLALGATDQSLRAGIKAGKYPELHMPSVNGWRKLMGRN